MINMTRSSLGRGGDEAVSEAATSMAMIIVAAESRGPASTESKAESVPKNHPAEGCLPFELDRIRLERLA